jgi:hypothetical protein
MDKNKRRIIMIEPIISNVSKLNKLLEGFNTKLTSVRNSEEPSNDANTKKVTFSDDIEINKYLYDIELLISELTVSFNRLDIFKDRFNGLTQIFLNMTKPPSNETVELENPNNR